MADKNFDALKNELFNTRKNGVLLCDEQTIKKAEEFCEGYKKYLDAAKTEREAVLETIKIAKANGFSEYIQGKKYNAGDRYYVNNRGKALALVVVGEDTVDKGSNILAAHIDSPRLDLKPNPLYEELEFALFKTHYYGGIKKYQWTAVPLALHGVIVKKDNTVLEVSIGENENEPCFVVNDLLPHLASEQYKRTLNEGIKGEELNILVGSYPFKSDEGGELVKLNILKILNEKYGITERDFLSAELECVPAYKATDVGFDRSMIGAYGQDDRVCAYPAIMATIDIKKPQKTLFTILADKEETGSDGNTGLNSAFIKYLYMDIAKAQGVDYSVALRNAKCLSADVNAGADPTFQDVLEKRNAAYLNYGAVITKYTGSRGKGGTSDASAEFMGYVRNLLDKAGVIWQTGELGKVDIGGGGTVAMYIANLGVDVVDLGVPVLSMHAPFETTAKLDVYMAYRAMYEFSK